ncbi:MAG: hypothetical protein ACFHHU_08345 [Porticoccaceae bacterium]
MDWLQRQYKKGSYIYSACSGSIMLAESGLLDDCPATSHWGYQDLFKLKYPRSDLILSQTWCLPTMRAV